MALGAVVTRDKTKTRSFVVPSSDPISNCEMQRLDFFSFFKL